MSINVTIEPGSSAIAVGVTDATWTTIAGKPATFPPSTHGHAESDISVSISVDGLVVDGTLYDALEVIGGHLSNRAEFSHEHGNITAGGTIGTTSGRVVTTGTGGAIQASSSIGSTSVANVVSTPSQITSNQNNYTLGTAADIFRISSDAARDITGVVATASGDAKVLLNVGSFSITLKNQSASSTAANRFLCAGGSDFVLSADSSCCIIYDSTTARWRVG